MTAGLTPGGDVRIYPLSGNVPSSLPALRRVQGAGTVRVAIRTQGRHAKGPKISDGKPRDWLTLLVKEELGSCLPFTGLRKLKSKAAS